MASTPGMLLAGAMPVAHDMVIDASTGQMAAIDQPATSFVVQRDPEAAAPPEPEELHPADAPQGLGDPAVVATATRRRRASASSKNAALARFAADPAGFAWLRDLLTQAHVHAISFRPDPYATAFNEGQRSIGNFVLSQLTAACGNARVGELLTGDRPDE
jgi:hypothetical protein